MKRIDSMTFLGIIVGLALVVIGIMMQGEISAFWNPSGLLITLGGSFGALMVNFRLEEIKMVISITRKAFVHREEDLIELNQRLIYLAHKARREGLLALEDELEKIEDPFFRNGLQKVVDGFEPEVIRSILNVELAALESRHELGQNLYRTWGMLLPASGMIGTLIGLVMMLLTLDDPSAIGPGMAVDLLTTFYGVLLANLLFIPLAGKLSIYSDSEIRIKELIIEALLALQSGISPRLLQEQIKAYFSPAEKQLLEERIGEERIGQEEMEEAASDV